MLLRLSSLAFSGMIGFLRSLAMSHADKDTEILALRHQPAVGQRQIDTSPARPARPGVPRRPAPHDPQSNTATAPLFVYPGTVLRWHHDLLRYRHARISRPRQSGHSPTVRRIRALVLRLARDNTGWGYRRIHGELATLGIKVAPSTVWEILKTHAIPPLPDRDHLTWATFLHNQAQALLAADFVDTPTLTGTRLFTLAVFEHATRPIRILGTTRRLRRRSGRQRHHHDHDRDPSTADERDHATLDPNLPS